MDRSIVLLRHGRTSWNAQRRFQGHADPPLDDVGRTQAYEVAPIIAAMGPGLLVSSSAVRARQTAAIVGEVAGLPVISEVRLRERGLGHWEGLTLDEVRAQFPDEYAEWVAGRDVVRRGGETRTDVAARAVAALAELSEVSLTVLVSHGATANILATALLGLDQERHPLAGLANCHWAELVVERRDRAMPAWRLRGYNLGAPGGVVPHPVVTGAEAASDADA